MVDSVSGNSAVGTARLSLQLASGRDPVDGKPGAVEQGRALDVRKADGGSAMVTSAGRAAVRDMAAEPPIDSARVAELRAAIASGSYRIEPEKIADAMLRSETGLFDS